MNTYQVKSPVLFLIFNRPAITKKVFEQIRLAKPTRLYIAADGPRAGNQYDTLLCAETRLLIESVDWDCKINTLYRPENLGCRLAVSSAITWFFENETEGIILEDDCLPGLSFFYFCDTLLERYRFDTRIRHIAGCNFQQGKQWGAASYYFSNLTHVWGWASWRRVWNDYNADLKAYHQNEARVQLKNIFTNSYIAESWFTIFKQMKAHEIDTWDYQLTFTNFFNNALTIIPNVNLVSNIGFGIGATHTTSTQSPVANIPLADIEDIKHPQYFLPEKQADLITLERDFNVKERIQKDNELKVRIKEWFKSSNYAK